MPETSAPDSSKNSPSKRRQSISKRDRILLTVVGGLNLWLVLSSLVALMDVVKVLLLVWNLTWLFRMFPPSMGRRRAVISGVLFGSLLLGMFGTVYARQSLKWERVHMTSQRVEDTIYLPPKLALRMSSLGYGPFWGDMLFIRAHAHFLRHINTDRILKWLDSYADAVITLDPDNSEIYHWASMVVRYGQTIDEAVIERSNKFAELGNERFPDDPRYYEHLGFNKYFELAPLKRQREILLSKKAVRMTELETTLAALVPSLVTLTAPAAVCALATVVSQERHKVLMALAQVRSERYELEREALYLYATATMLPGSTIDPLFLVTLYVRQDKVGAAAIVAERMYADATPDQREHLLARLNSLGQEGLVRRLEATSQARAEEMPYASPILFDLIGSVRSLRVPRSWADRGEALDDAMRALDAREAGESTL